MEFTFEHEKWGSLDLDHPLRKSLDEGLVKQKIEEMYANITDKIRKEVAKDEEQKEKKQQLKKRRRRTC